MNNEYFYENLDSFTDFEQLSNIENYHKMPENWFLIISDIKGSTKAIENGKYRDVNTVGAASIVAVQEAIGNNDFPFVFGGDGATFIVPPSKYEKVVNNLVSLQDLSSIKYGLEIRIGAITVKELISFDVQINVAKFELFAGRSIAIFNGGGLSLADSLIKNNEDKYLVQKESKKELNLNALSCRWNPIKNHNGKILSLLIEASSNNFVIYGKVLKQIDYIFEGKLEQANPVNFEKTTYKSFKQCIKDEGKLHNSLLTLNFLKRVCEIIISVLIFKMNIKFLFTNADKYIKSMPIHSDYRKFDDMLRMIIDCTDDQHQKLIHYLNELEGNELIKYGMHESDDCLMTCFVENTNDGNHIHFIDGGNGGYAMAAKHLKSK